MELNCTYHKGKGLVVCMNCTTKSVKETNFALSRPETIAFIKRLITMGGGESIIGQLEGICFDKRPVTVQPGSVAVKYGIISTIDRMIFITQKDNVFTLNEIISVNQFCDAEMVSLLIQAADEIIAEYL